MRRLLHETDGWEIRRRKSRNRNEEEVDGAREKRKGWRIERKMFV
jgi:hypothetical protein